MKKLLAFFLCLITVFCLLVGCNSKPVDPTDPPATEPPYTATNIADLLKLPIADGETTEERYYIVAKVDSVDNPTYGAMTVSDATGTIYVYNSKNADGTVGYADMTDKPYAGDSVVIYGNIKNYKGTIEVGEGFIVEFTHAKVDIDDSNYTAMSIAQAREAATGTKVKVDGIVAQITYANGYIPSGVILVDETASIYVYDNELAGRVQKGNKITVLASKTYWILADETNNANKFGYKGCNQLESAVLVDNDNKTDNSFDKSWIQESTVKAIMDTPVSTDITTLIFKVTAQVKKSPGAGFTNYYFNDLDGVTGSYAYTQCNGGDFAWLDAFDGKICTVYLMALNAKSTASGCNWRFLPIHVVDENFTFDMKDAAKHAVEYNGVTQFLPSYSGNPKLELVTSVDSALLGFTGATLSYASDNTSVVAFEGKDGKIIMNCLASGTARITVTGTHNGNTYSKDITITVTANTTVDFINVGTAITTAVGETVTVKGIVGPSLVNQTGFYLIDNTGVIAVLTDKDTLATLKPGYEVILTGNRFQKQKDGSKEFGQSCIQNAQVVANNYGENTYDDSTFITGKSLAEIAAADNAVDFTTNIYVTKATVKVTEGQYSSTISIADGDTNLLLYCSGAKQYAFLQQFAGQEVTIELALCNWNCKGYKGCVLAVRLADGTKVINTLNFQN